jgi:hypothetical protein
MNERIKELAREAGLLAYNPEGPPTKLEKFAELIVQDCIDILAGYRGKVIWKNEDEMHQHPIFVIQKHFGVEE